MSCGALLRFDPATLEMRSLHWHDGSLVDTDGVVHETCQNDPDFGVCNWLRARGSSHPLCFGCQFNRTIPNLSTSVNKGRWARFETAKKRLFYTLLRLRLPLANGFVDPGDGLLLDFIEDRRTDPACFPESFAHTGFLGGVITINVLEADDAAREAMRVEMGESYRTMLGHLRHESGHYYWSLFNAGPDDLAAYSAIFGDISANYEDALRNYYANGPQLNWGDRHISAYASAHPLEDWAETWGHYMHIYDVLETAAVFGLSESNSGEYNVREAVSIWRRLSVVLNELNRSIGVRDAYPFVVNSIVEDKLVYVDSVIRRLQTHP